MRQQTKLVGANIYLDFPSVGCNRKPDDGSFFSSKALRFLENAAQEPEIVDLANFLKQNGRQDKRAPVPTPSR